MIEILEFSDVENQRNMGVRVSKSDSWFGFLGSAVLLLSSLPLIARATVDLIYRIGIFFSLAAVPAGFLYHLLRNQSFVFAANHDGFFYRVYAELNQSVFVPWRLVQRVYVEWGDVSREVIFEVSNEIAMLPRPANGEARQLDEVWRVDFSPGHGRRKIRRIVEELNALRTSVKSPDEH